MKVPITIKTSYNMAEVPSLVDSGATNNFIHPRMIRQLRLGTSLLDKPKKLFNVDDTQNKAGSVTRYVDLSVTTNQEEQQMRFLVSDIGRESLILGYPWLAAFEPHFKWKEGTLDPHYLPITCQSIRPAQRQEDQQERRAIVTQLEEECTNWTIATELAINARSEPSKVELPEVYKKYASVFSEEEAQRFPPSRPWDHAINFKDGAPDAIDCKVYPMTHTEDNALDKFIDEQLAKGYICPLISPYASSFFFIKKKDGKLRPVQDYRNINKWMVRNQYPLPLITTLIRELGGAMIYTKLDVQWGYNNVCIKAEDEHKAAFKTRRGLYEPTVMFFSLTNSPATFQAMMNVLYRDTIRKHESRGTTIRIYMDDIAIATKNLSLPLHEAAVSNVLQVAKDNSLFFKLSKASSMPQLSTTWGSYWKRGRRGWTRPRCQEFVTGLPQNALRMSAPFTDFATFTRPLLQDFPRSPCPSTRSLKRDNPSYGQPLPNRHSICRNEKLWKNLSSSIQPSRNRLNSKSTPQDSP